MAHDLTRNPLEPSLNPPHDTKDGNKTTCITVLIHHMILDMIQGCRYLRRSTDRWLLSKNSTTRLKDSKVGTGPVCCEIVRFSITNAKGSYLYPCPNTTPSRPRLQHLLPKLMPRRQCPSCTRHQFVPSLYSGHVITYSRMFPLPSAKQPFCRMMACSRPQASLPNALRKISCQMVFSYKTRPTGQSLSCTNFWC
jgi:hypothetical protein